MNGRRPLRILQPLTKLEHMVPVSANPPARSAAQYMSVRILFHYQRQFGSVGFDDLANPDRSRALLRRKPADRNLLSGLERIPCPSGPHQMVGAGQFTLPFRDRTVPLFDVQINQSVRVCKIKPGDCAGYADLPVLLIPGSSMVAETKVGNHAYTECHRADSHPITLHRPPPGQ